MARWGCGVTGHEKQQGSCAEPDPARGAASRQEAADAEAEEEALSPLPEEADPALCALLCGAYTAAL